MARMYFIHINIKNNIKNNIMELDELLKDAKEILIELKKLDTIKEEEQKK